MQVSSLDGEDPLEEGRATHSSILPGESHGWRSLAGYSPWGYKESDIIERLISRLMSTLPRIESCAAIASDLQQPLERCSRKRSGMRHSEIGKNLAR